MTFSHNLPANEKLDIAHFQRLFDNMSECYKLFWFKGIVDEISAGRTVISYNTIIDNMIADAWYMVSEYRLNLGPKDTLEKLISYTFKTTGMKSSASRTEILKGVSSSEDRQLLDFKKKLTQMVPYRLQVPLTGLTGRELDGTPRQISARINSFPNTIYKYGNIDGLNTVIRIDENWAEYIRDNSEIISGWIYYNTVRYLQKRNPSVPGISSKLFPPQERKLDKVK